MTTKYAKAKDTAYQWRAEYRKVKEENRSLRRVLAAAQEFIRIADDPNRLPIQYANARTMLKAQIRAVVLAVGGE